MAFDISAGCSKHTVCRLLSPLPASYLRHHVELVLHALAAGPADGVCEGRDVAGLRNVLHLHREELHYACNVPKQSK